MLLVVGSHRSIMSGGKTSLTPPTLLLTTKSPQQAASKLAIQNASVKVGFMNICPFTRML